MTLLISSTLAGVIFSIAALVIDSVTARKKSLQTRYLNYKNNRL